MVKLTSTELRKRFLEFFEKRGHKIVPSSSLIPTDSSVLFTTAGMQQFKEYFLDKESPYGKRAASCQKCFRMSDIEEVGDDIHLTFLEMLGNFSFHDYFKKEAIELAYEFLFKELKLPLEQAFFTIFEGDEKVPKDKESLEILINLGIPKEKIKLGNKEDNFWGPTGQEGPCGPTTEIYINNIEIWNLVFNEYEQDKQGKLSVLKQKGVDTGMGLERLSAVCQGKSSVYETDLFLPIMAKISGHNEKAKRIISDHIRGICFLISEGIMPLNVEQGYVLRRLIRRAIRYGKILGLPQNFLIPLAQKIIAIYKDIYPELLSKQTDILTVLQKEEEKFEKTLDKGIKETSLIIAKGDISGKQAFDLYQSYGFPIEMLKEMAKEQARQVDEKGFEQEFKKHQEVSKAGVEKKFGGGGKFSPKLHTATHLLHFALRQVLGKEVKQMGSDITEERLRFDFSFQRKLTDEELKKVEDLVNQKIKQDLEVKKEEMPLEQAINTGALAFFKEKYPEKVSVYSIGSFSKEICGGPHIKKTSELGHFRIIKQESVGAGIRRIKANLLY